MKKIGYFIGAVLSVLSLPVCFAYGIGLFDSDEAYMKRTGLTVEEALEKGVLSHPENYSGHCDFSQLPDCNEFNELEIIFGEGLEITD